MSAQRPSPIPGSVDRPSVADAVIEQLEALVFAGLDPGEPLPSEGKLAERLGVSRLTVREAMRALEARGLLETRRGRVPTVAAPSGALVGDFFKSAIRRDPRAALELIEVRMALEVHIAALAAHRATRTAIAQSEMALAAMWEAEDDPSAFNEADVRFHESLAAATGNRLLFWIIEAFAEPLHEGRLKSFAGHLARGGSNAPLIRQHEEILDAVKARDAQAAAAAMRHHLRETEKDLRAVTSVGPAGEAVPISDPLELRLDGEGPAPGDEKDDVLP